MANQDNNNQNVMEKIQEIQEQLQEIQQEKKEANKKQKQSFYIKTFFIGIVVLILFVSLLLMKRSFDFFTSPKFLQALQYKTMEVMPYVSDQLGKKAKEVAPEVYKELEGEINSYLPKLSKQITEKYIPTFLESIEEKSKDFIDQSLNETEKKIDKFAKQQIDDIMQEMEKEMKKKGIDKFDKETIESLKKAMIKTMETQLDELTLKKFEENMKQCVSQGERIFSSIESFKNIPESKRQKHAFEIFRGFVDGLEYISNGRIPEEYERQFVSEKEFEEISTENLGKVCSNLKIFKTPEEKALYNIYMRKTKGGKYEIVDLTKEPWRNSYDKEVRQRVWRRLQCQLNNTNQ